ncbi:MAG TPA: GNAT family N-acetyltransferase [Flavipsychrobacter sp.]|nr:GNAT family N-acetyltransferase [Flavipsychrobacter sp.]
MIHVKTLSSTPVLQIADTFNKAFKNYQIPIHFTESDLSRKFRVESIDLDYSIGAFNDGELVGFMLQGVGTFKGEKTAWNGGTGVLPLYRGRQLTEKMYSFAIPLLQDMQVKKLVLEVLQPNIIAKTIYSRSGFEEKRLLHAYRGVLKKEDKLLYEVVAMESFDVEQLSVLDDWSPCWQLSNTAIRQWSDSIQAFCIKEQDKLLGYLLYNKASKRVSRFAVDKKHRNKGVAMALFQHVANTFDENISVVNIDATSENTNAFLQRLGLKNFLSQYEMERAI